MGLITEGFGDLIDDMTDMAAELGPDSKSIAEALKQGAVPIEQKMISNASRDPKVISGNLRSSIHTGPVKKRRDGGKRITIGVHHKENSAYYANPVEYGHGGPAPAPAHPFVRPAFDAQKEAAYSAMKEVLLAAISNRK